MKVKLDIADRLNLLSILPAQGDILTIRKVDELRTKMVFTDKEIDKYKIKVVESGDGRVGYSWDKELKYAVEFEIGEIAQNAIIKTLKQLDEDKQLFAYHITLFDKFCAPEDTESK